MGRISSPIYPNQPGLFFIAQLVILVEFYRIPKQLTASGSPDNEWGWNTIRASFWDRFSGVFASFRECRSNWSRFFGQQKSCFFFFFWGGGGGGIIDDHDDLTSVFLFQSGPNWADLRKRRLLLLWTTVISANLESTNVEIRNRLATSTKTWKVHIEASISTWICIVWVYTVHIYTDTHIFVEIYHDRIAWGCFAVLITHKRPTGNFRAVIRCQTFADSKGRRPTIWNHWNHPKSFLKAYLFGGFKPVKELPPPKKLWKAIP